jgi:hypothetical protein
LTSRMLILILDFFLKSCKMTVVFVKKFNFEFYNEGYTAYPY